MSGDDVAWMANVMPDWTTLQLVTGECFAFNRETGRIYALPHPDCPFVIIPHCASVIIPAELSE